MLCSKCGSELGEDKICPKCGATSSNLFATEEYDPLKALEKEEHVIWQEAPITGEEKLNQPETEKLEENKQVETTNNVAKGIKAAKSTLSNPIKPKNRIAPQDTSQSFKIEEVDLEKSIENIPKETPVEEISIDETPVEEQVSEQTIQQEETETVSQPITENMVEEVEEVPVSEPVTPTVEETITKTVEEESVAEEIVEQVTTTDEVVMGDVVIGDVIGDDVVDIFDDFVEEEPVTPPVEKTVESMHETQSVAEELEVEGKNAQEPVTQEVFDEVKIEPEPIVTPIIEEPVVKESKEPIVETAEDTEIRDILEEMSDSTNDDKPVVDVESLLQEIKGTDDKQEIPDIDEAKTDIAETSVEEEINESVEEEVNEPIEEELQEDVLKTEKIVEETETAPEPKINKIVKEESPIIKSMSSTSDETEQVVKKIVPDNRDEDIKAKFNRTFEEDELEEIDVDENINSLTGKITTVLIIVLILIIAAVLATFLVQNIGL